MSIPAKTKRRVTVRTLGEMRRSSTPIAMLTAYDFPTAKQLDEAGVDILLVGDSLAMVVGGHDNTIPVTVDQMIYHAEMVARASRRAMVVVDLPFPEGARAPQHVLDVSARILKETSAQAVKIEGGTEQCDRIECLHQAGIAVMGHIGLQPQSVHAEGGYGVKRDVEAIIADAVAIEKAGVFAMVIECVSSEIGKAVTEAVSVPTIGIGAGPDVNGQVLVTHDLLGFYGGHQAKFVRRLADLNGEIRRATESYVEAVRSGDYPNADESFQ